MGTYAGFYGEQKIKEELKEEYCENLIKILNAGGMMQLEVVSLDEIEIRLIKKLTPNENGYISFYYNYFGDEVWENAGINLNTCEFYSNKIGSGEFCDVILAAYVLTEFYTEEFGIARINGDIFDAKEIIGWLNYVLDKQFTNIRAIDAFKILETCPCLYRDNISDIVQNCGCKEAISISSLITYLYFTRNENSLWNEIVKDIGENQTIDDILTMENAIKRIKDNGKTYEEMLDLTFDIENYGFFCPKVTILIQLCETYEKDFWEEYKKYKYKLLSSAYKLWKGDSSKLKSIEKISTAKYLDIPDSSLRFMYSEAKENYHKSDDDFALFWTPDCELEFSEDFNNWCNLLKQDFEEIKDIFEMISAEIFIKNFIESLKYANDTYRRIYAPSSMFYEFICNSENKNYQVAYKLFVKLLEDNFEEGKVDETVTYDWNYEDINIRFNKGRLNIKRYLAIMGNVELRNKIFGF